jgi:stringent starvation protein B
MSELTSTKPYMLRAIHQWCLDNNLTPHLLVTVDGSTRVPMAYVKNNEIVLNLNYGATKDLQLDIDAVVFSARFGGISQNLYVPMHAVKAIFARENGQGMFFEAEAENNLTDSELLDSSEFPAESASASDSKQIKKLNSKKPTLTIVK